MIKKLIFILLLMSFCLFISVELSAQTDELTREEIIELIQNSKTVVIGVTDIGFWKWLKGNWYFFLGFLIGLGRVIVWFTPTKKDDEWYGKIIIKPFRLIGKIISGGIAADKKPKPTK